jgi:BolA protein
MSIRDIIETKLDNELTLQHLEVLNESASHNVPAGSESHFKVVLVAEAFESMRLLQRHRQINTILAEELAGTVHALAIHAYTLTEWQARHGDAPLSPPCLGGSRHG